MDEDYGDNALMEEHKVPVIEIEDGENRKPGSVTIDDDIMLNDMISADNGVTQ